jgi:hypothetical protein
LKEKWQKEEIENRCKIIQLEHYEEVNLTVEYEEIFMQMKCRRFVDLWLIIGQKLHQT